jgi:hypothetical protein
MKPVAILRWFSLCLLLGLFGSVSAQTPDHSATVSTSPAYVEQARKTIDAVLAEPEFDRTRIIKEARIKDSPDDKKRGLLARFFDWLEKLLRGDSRDTSSNKSSQASSFALPGQIILWFLVFVLVALLLIYSKHWLPLFGWRRSRAVPSFPVQQTDSALEIDAALPENIVTAARRCWEEGRKAEALSLLYRGTIELLTAHHRIDLPQGATEEEIRLLVGSAMPSFKDDFGNIARAWLRLAYAHRPPADIIDLLAGFNRLQQAGGMAS